MDILLEVKKSFFDREKVARAVGDANRKALSRFGGAVRLRARRSMRRRADVSEPGQAPSAHAGQLKELLFYAWDEKSKSVVAGPVPLRTPTGVPRLLEEGGTVMVPAGDGGRRPARYRKFPYMAPALEAERPKLADLYKASLKG